MKLFIRIFLPTLLGVIIAVAIFGYGFKFGTSITKWHIPEHCVITEIDADANIGVTTLVIGCRGFYPRWTDFVN